MPRRMMRPPASANSIESAPAKSALKAPELPASRPGRFQFDASLRASHAIIAGAMPSTSKATSIVNSSLSVVPVTHAGIPLSVGCVYTWDIKRSRERKDPVAK